MLSKRTFQFNPLARRFAELPKHHLAIERAPSPYRVLLSYIFSLQLMSPTKGKFWQLFQELRFFMCQMCAIGFLLNAEAPRNIYVLPCATSAYKLLQL